MPISSEYLAGSPPVVDQLQNGDGNWHRHLRFELLNKCASFTKKGSSSSPVWNVLFTARLSRLASTIHCSRFRRLERSKRFERSRRSERSEMWTERNSASTHGFRLASLIGLPSMDCVHRRIWTSNKPWISTESSPLEDFESKCKCELFIFRKDTGRTKVLQFKF